jgi:putrescine aminotransferase
MTDTRLLIRELAASSPPEVRRLHADHINPVFVKALGLLGYGRDFVTAEGASLRDAEGLEYLDFLAGYGSVPLGHNHPEVRAAVEEALALGAPNFIQVAPQPLAAALAARLARLAPGDLGVSYFMSSGSEVVDGALKLARAATRRERFVSAADGYHGTTWGALSVTGGERSRAPFEPLLPGCKIVPWGEVDAIAAELRTRDVAAVILEPLQAEGGMNLPPPGYLADVARLCRKYGTLFILDEIQTGLGRTGRMFACEIDGVEPDVLLLAKGLSGGLVPIGAYTTRKDVWTRAYGTLDRYDAHCATFSGAPLACAAAIATLEIIERDRLASRAVELGGYLGERLREVTRGHSLVREVRGRGLLWGVELLAPGGGVSADLIGGWLSVGLIERRVVTQVAVHAPAVVRAEPPLIIDRVAVDRFAEALRGALAEHSTGVLSSFGGAAKRMVSQQVARLVGGAR